MSDADMFLGGLKDLENLQSFHPYNPMEPKENYLTQWPMVVIRDSFLNSNKDNDNDNDFSIFPPCNHENLTPSFSPPPPSPSSSPSLLFTPLSFPPSDSDSYPPPSPPSVSLVPRWWGFAFRILRAKIANVGSYFVGRRGGGNVRPFWQVGNVGLAALVVVMMWWLCLRVRRRWRRKESVGHFLKIVRKKDEKIIELLNQIAQMNELLLARHKAMTAKLVD